MYSDQQTNIPPPPHLPKDLVTLRSCDGAEISVSLYGGHVCSWRTADGVERLFLSTLTKWDSLTAIRGGIPVIFPQFANRGLLPKHGFARTSLWALLASGVHENGDGFMHLALCDTAETRLQFPYYFRLELQVTFSGASLSTELFVTNKGPEPFSFTSALHSYLAADITRSSIHGLSGLPNENSRTDYPVNFDNLGVLHINAEVDCIFFQADDPVTLVEETFAISSQQSGFKDVVVWNPWRDGSRSIVDLEDDAYKYFVCIESATIENAISLAAGHQWSGCQQLTVRSLSDIVV